jgi:hypothetical protein
VSTDDRKLELASSPPFCANPACRTRCRRGSAFYSLSFSRSSRRRDLWRRATERSMHTGELSPMPLRDALHDRARTTSRLTSPAKGMQTEASEVRPALAAPPRTRRPARRHRLLDVTRRRDRMLRLPGTPLDSHGDGRFGDSLGVLRTGDPRHVSCFDRATRSPLDRLFHASCISTCPHYASYPPAAGPSVDSTLASLSGSLSCEQLHPSQSLPRLCPRGGRCDAGGRSENSCAGTIALYKKT